MASARTARKRSKRTCKSLRACLETTRGASARDFGCGQGGEFRASPQRAVRNESTPATDKRPAARRVFGEKAVWLRCSSVEDPPGIFSFVAPSGLFPENSAPRSFQTGSKRHSGRNLCGLANGRRRCRPGALTGRRAREEDAASGDKRDAGSGDPAYSLPAATKGVLAARSA